MIKLSSIFVAVLTGCLLMIPAGMFETGSIFRIIELLLLDDTTLPLTLQLTVLPKVGAIFGSLLFGILAEVVGRKYIIPIICTPMFIASILFQTDLSYVVVCTANVLTGLTLGGIYTILPIYIGEVASKFSRGRLMALMYPSYILGSFLVGIVGLEVSSAATLLFTNYSTIALTLSVILLSMLRIKNNDYRYFMNSEEGEQDELEIGNMNSKLNSNHESSDTVDERNIFLKLSWTKPFLLVTGLYILRALSGFYTFKNHFLVGDMELDTTSLFFIIGFTSLATSCLFIYLVEKIGRKESLVISFIGTFFSCVLLLLHSILKVNQKYNIIVFLHFLIFINIGAGPIPLVLVGEIFPRNKKTIFAGVSTAFLFVIEIAVLHLQKYSVQTFGLIDVWVYMCISAVSIWIVKNFYIETKQKDLNEIQVLLK